MNPYDFRLLDWHDNLLQLNTWETAQWILGQRRKAYDGLEINRERLAALYEEWGLLYRARESDLPENFPEEDRARFFNNQRVVKSRKYQKAIILLHSPLPNFHYLPKGDTHYQPIPNLIWERNPQLVIQTALEKAEEELREAEELLRDSSLTPDAYRAAVRQLLHKRFGKNREMIKYSAATKEKEEFERCRSNKDDIIRHFDELDLGLDIEVSKHWVLESYGIGRTHIKSFLEERCDKGTLIRLCFALNIRGNNVERFLNKEGITLKNSVRAVEKQMQSVIDCGATYKEFVELMKHRGACKG